MNEPEYYGPRPSDEEMRIRLMPTVWALLLATMLVTVTLLWLPVWLVINAFKERKWRR